MFYFSATVPARFCGEKGSFETIDIVADVDNRKVKLVSEEGKKTITLDLIGTAVLADVLQNLKNCTKFNNSIKKDISEHIGRLNAYDGTVW